MTDEIDKIDIDNESDCQDNLDNLRKFKLDNFEGPLQLLLTLIKDSKLDIKTIKLGEITGQYLDAVHKMDIFDMNGTCEFIEMAATLIEIKSKYLIPREDDDDQEIVIPEEMLLKLRLQELELLQSASVKMKELEDINKYYKSADETVGDYRYVLKQMTLDKLLDAFTKMMVRAEVKQKPIIPKTITKDRFTVKEEMTTIHNYVNDKKQIVFEELFEDDFSKMEVITVFMALLELLKLQKVKVTQEKYYSKIIINAVEEGENDEEIA